MNRTRLGVASLVAILMVAVFLVHLARIMKRLFVDKETSILWGPGSMVPQPRDLHEMDGHFRWFVGLGPRPRFDRYSYWEKFDYWAVFWGMGIIGTSGLMLWFPAFFARFVPGWIFNIALVVHGEEALMAMVFIFTVHFFNGHLRPDKFPMDLVIFTGRVRGRSEARASRRIRSPDRGRQGRGDRRTAAHAETVPARTVDRDDRRRHRAASRNIDDLRAAKLISETLRRDP